VKRAIRAIEIAEYYKAHALERQTFPTWRSLIIGINIERDERRRRITARLHERLEAGMIEEVRRLLAQGLTPEDLIYYGLEYKYITLYLTGELNYEEMTTQLEIAIHQFAKRQMTWFRGMERRGFKIHWIDAMLPPEEKVERVLSKLKQA
jgi:tRNA dimethylallyltransferase